MLKQTQQQRSNISIWHFRAIPLMLLLLIFLTNLFDNIQQDHHHHIYRQQKSNTTTNNTTNTTSTTTPRGLTPPSVKTTRVTNNNNIINSFHGVKARAFEKWKSPHGVPCFPPTSYNKKNRERGLLFLKLHKVGSSTAAGVNALIARNVARRRRRTRSEAQLVLLLKNNTTRAIATRSVTTSPSASQKIDFDGSCDAQLAHATAKTLCPRRDKRKSYLWSIVRDPTSRVLSRFFHTKISLNKREPTDEAAIRFFCHEGDHYMSRLSTVAMKSAIGSSLNSSNNTRTKNNKNPKMMLSDQDRVKYANLIMKEYDFIGVTERMDESAVALSMLLDIPLADVLYLDGKVTGGYGLGNCIYFVQSFQSPAVEEYMQTRKFQECTKWDRILHQVANRSLDLTIEETLGREKFEAKLAKFRSALAFANEYCDDSNVVFSCTSGGVNNNKKENDCLYHDSGCGYRCLDEVAKKLNLDL